MSIRSKRKDEHVDLALSLESFDNDFAKVRIIHNSLPGINFKEVSLESSYFNHLFKFPIYINAMTGGSEKTLEINRRLAKVAKRFDLAMAVGSQHVALDDNAYEPSFKIVREINPNGFIIGNVSANASVEQAKRAIEMIQADALGIHINVAQELTMDEGDRDFASWLENIKAIVQNVDVPVIVKEVGFGMSKKTVQTLIDYGVSYVDISGRGGTNFIAIENSRSEKKRFDYLNDWGISAVESLLMTKPLHDSVEIVASGGVKNPLDVIKLLSLGAKAVGISKTFLEAVQNESIMFETVEDFLGDLKKMMMLCGVKSVEELKEIEFQLHGHLGELYGKTK